MDPRVQNMCRLASGRHLRSLVIVPSLLVMLAFPASAQTNSDPWIKRTDSASARNQLELNHSPTSLHLAKTKSSLQSCRGCRKDQSYDREHRI